MADGVTEGRNYHEVYERIRQGFEKIGQQAPPIEEVQGLKLTSMGSDVYDHLADALAYQQAAARTYRVRTTKTVTDFSDAELIMELIRRGYAAMKLPSDGGPPEVLRGKTDN